MIQNKQPLPYDDRLVEFTCRKGLKKNPLEMALT